MSREELLDYLKILIDLESDKYTELSILAQLNQKVKNCDKELAITQKNIDSAAIDGLVEEPKKDKPWVLLWLLLFALPLGGVGILIFQLVNVAWSIAICMAWFIISMIIAKADDNQLKKQRKAEAAERAAKREEVKQRMLSTRIARKNEISSEITVLCNEIKVLLETREITDVILDAYYETGVIPEKYRNLVALCSFYDYIASGRTCSICINPGKNDEGAVNIYERERVAYKMIEQLDAIGSNLGMLHEEQRMLRRTIEEGNAATQSMLRGISSDIKTGNDRLAMIQYQNAQQLKYQRYMADATWHERMSH